MSQPSRPQSRGPAQRRRRDVKLERPIPLEDRRLPAPVVTLYPYTATFAAAATPTNADLGTVTVSESSTVTPLTAAPITSVSELTPNSSFGGDIVNITPGPGGVFGDDVYAISRGSGGNPDAINRPGVIYRVDPATGQASVFFDLNTVLSQTDDQNTSTTTPAANSLGAGTGLVNWYSMTFDPEGEFDGTPSLFVASVDRSDPNKNIIFQISPSGTLIGVFTQMTDGLSSLKFNINPTAILIPPVQDQSFLSGMIAGSGVSSTGGEFAALYFNSSAYSPGQVISNATLPTGVSQTNLGLAVDTDVLTNANSVVTASVNTGPIVGLTASNATYGNQVFSIFTDFGTPAGGGIPAKPGYSGVQESSDGDLFIGIGANASTTLAAGAATDTQPAATTDFRRFYGIAFDQYGYFSQGFSFSTSSSTTGGTTYTLGSAGASYVGSLFVSDLSSGLYVTVTPLAPLPTTPIIVPVQGSGTVSVTTNSAGTVIPIVTNGNTTDGTNVGGRIIRISPTGVVYQFAQDFDTSAAQDSSSFEDSTLSIGFSADGTALYAADDQGIWQFMTTADLADSTSGSLIGLNDLRALGVPYDGQNSAVAVVDTGVDAKATSFRGRVAPGTNVVTNGLGNMDTAPAGGSVTTTGTGSTGGGGTSSTVLSNSVAGHGTPVAGVIAQFVPDATIDPVNIFTPYIGPGSVSLTGTGSTGSSTGAGGTGGTIVSNADGASATTLYDGLQYLIQHPYVSDPIRPGQVDRVIAAVYAFGTPYTFATEADAYKQFPQVVIALKNEYHKLRKEGIANIAATGEFGAPLLASSSTTTSSTSSAGTSGALANNNAENSRVGDDQGISLPAIINEVISVTGVYSFPFKDTPSTSPVDTPTGVIPNPAGPILLFGNSLTIATPSTSSGGTGGTAATSNVTLLAEGDINIYADRIPGAVNRNVTTDFAAPAFNVPTFARTYSPTSTSTSTTGTGATSTGVVSNPLTFTQVGTSMSAAIVTGAYAMVSSALNYWTNLATSSGYTDDAYLNTPVGTDSLNFGKHAFKNLSAWNTPDGINGILAWTAVPATDTNDANTISTPSTLTDSTAYPSYARISVSNAIAAIEGTEAINYLTKHHDWKYIDTAHDGLITPQELTTFVDSASSKGLAEAGAMAALLGGNATYGPVEAGINNTVYNENPDQPGAEQRRFNFFDYAADGQLNGSISINELEMLGKTLLPSPDAYTIIDRQRASANGFLLAPATPRNFAELKYLKPSYLWVPKSSVAKYRNITPAQFTVGEDTKTGQYLPIFTLFDPSITNAASGTGSVNNQVVGLVKSSDVAGHKFSVGFTVNVVTPTPTTSSTTGSTTAASSGTSNTGTTTSSGTTTVVTSTTTTTTGTGATTTSSGGSGSSSPTSLSSSPTPTPTPSPTTTPEQESLDGLIDLVSTGSSTPTSTPQPTSTALGSSTLSTPVSTSLPLTQPTPTSLSVAGTLTPVPTPSATTSSTPSSTETSPTPTTTTTPTTTPTSSSSSTSTSQSPAPEAYAVTVGTPSDTASASEQAAIPSRSEKRAEARTMSKTKKSLTSSISKTLDSVWSSLKKI